MNGNGMTDIDARKLSEDLKTFLHQHNMNQVDFSRMSDISQSVISRLVRGEKLKVPKRSTLEPVCRIIGKTVEDYLSVDEPQEDRQLSFITAPMDARVDYQRLEEVIFRAVRKAISLDTQSGEVE